MGSPGQNASDRTSTATAVQNGANGPTQLYIGVQAGSDLEQYGYQGAGANQPGAAMGAKYSPFRSYYGSRKPLYKVGYQNSKDFARELNNMDPNIIYLYQQRLNAAGLLDNFVPGKLDKSTRAAFKELLTQANQTASTWQSTLQDIESVGGVVGKGKEQGPFVADLEDPVTLRQAFQGVARDLYGGDLPDDEINRMVDAYRSQQLAAEQANYNLEASNQPGTKANLPSDVDFAKQQLEQNHPDQLARVKFSDTLGTILDTLKSSPASG